MYSDMFQQKNEINIYIFSFQNFTMLCFLVIGFIEFFIEENIHLKFKLLPKNYI